MFLILNPDSFSSTNMVNPSDEYVLLSARPLTL